ncbi:AAA-ATPase ASD, mitochondrial-like [Punica granatum]|uniref:AAA+ ATPase domain-containing protein n=2 Tax=Punica granatum TaxID=22663 RepID=A0A218WNQ1_PUNGR|nr:AAA-ATPase ASD, mitochondrial-like [Punica granatum]OWM73990.1 hypothetical protein CDL15_Pgr022261 [Punica granatum]PKI46511.1 hypothetical protein CRG98_033068 [Punica granatum]
MRITMSNLMGGFWASLGSTVASMMFFWAIFQHYVPEQLRAFVKRQVQKLLNLFYPYVQITFQENSDDDVLRRGEVFSLVETYLGSCFASGQAKRLRANYIKNSRSIRLTLDDYEEVIDTFHGVRLWWSSTKTYPTTTTVSVYPSSNSDYIRSFRLTFHHSHRELVTGTYLNHVLEEAKAARLKNRQRKLFTNGAGGTWHGYNKSKWCHVAFEHPATFETLAMDPKKKQDIMNDLVTFTKAKDYYAKIGKTWKRGYLLYGPPGTGKSTMIPAMANLLSYDVYDLEITAVKDNTELRKLLIETTSKSIIVIEDIDCSLDLTRQRKMVEANSVEKSGTTQASAADPVKAEKENEKDGSKVTLLGLLNMIDGLWSACDGERLIVFTTNFLDKLDPALTWRGRMDMHIEMSYCRFEAFKVLVKNYWDLSEHCVFGTIEKLLEEIDMTPADVSENLMPKSANDNAETCLMTLINALEKTNEASKVKTNAEQVRGEDVADQQHG